MERLLKCHTILEKTQPSFKQRLCRWTSGETAHRERHKNKKIIINCDSQAAVKAVGSTKIKSKTTQKACNELHKLGQDNLVFLGGYLLTRATLETKKLMNLPRKVFPILYRLINPLMLLNISVLRWYRSWIYIYIPSNLARRDGINFQHSGPYSPSVQ